MTERSSPDIASAELKRSEVLAFDDGLLTVKMSGHGKANGWATMAFNEKQFELDDEGYQIVEIPPSELFELRDFLNRVLPINRPGDASARSSAGTVEASARQLEDLKLAAENFRRAMIQSGATSHVKQSLYMEQLRALECALNPLNFRVDPAQPPCGRAGGNCECTSIDECPRAFAQANQE